MLAENLDSLGPFAPVPPEHAVELSLAKSHLPTVPRPLAEGGASSYLNRLPGWVYPMHSVRSGMAHTTIKVESSVRDRLAILAAEKDTTIAGLVAEFATHTLTQSERDEQVAKTLEVLHALSGYAPDPEQDRAADDELTRRLGSAA